MADGADGAAGAAAGLRQGGVTGGNLPTGEAGRGSIVALVLGDEASSTNIFNASFDLLLPAGVGGLGGSMQTLGLGTTAAELVDSAIGDSSAVISMRVDRRVGLVPVLAEVGLVGVGAAT